MLRELTSVGMSNMIDLIHKREIFKDIKIIIYDS